MSRTRRLDFVETRVLGALLEKEQVTPDHYPLTIAALIAACNQKTSRDPVTELTETEVVEALDRLVLDALTMRRSGSRAERWVQRLDRRWGLDAPRKAIVTVLLLRGPQSPGELRTRTERMHSFASKEEVEALLREMAGEFDPLVMELSREPGHRERRWIHLMLEGETPSPAEAEPPPSVAAATAGPPPPSGQERLTALEGEVDALRQELGGLRSELRALRIRLGDLAVEEEER